MPVYSTSQGVKFTKKRHPTSIPDAADFRAQEIDILVGNYDTHGKKVPKNVAMKAYEIIDQRDREHGSPHINLRREPCDGKTSTRRNQSDLEDKPPSPTVNGDDKTEAIRRDQPPILYLLLFRII